MRILVALSLVALTGCQDIHGRDTVSCIERGYSPKKDFMACIVKLDRQRLAAWKAAQPKPQKGRKNEKPSRSHQ